MRQNLYEKTVFAVLASALAGALLVTSLNMMGESCDRCILVDVIDMETIKVESPRQGTFLLWFRDDASPQVQMHRALAATLTESFAGQAVTARLHVRRAGETNVDVVHGTCVTFDGRPATRVLSEKVQDLATATAKNLASQ